ncbi:MAG: magnesium transporter [Thermogemmatispora sp.]|uniref:magnesium transporter n=2 Tax=Thermogemmatispora sp. TaxID=1968838 RepID=UPI001DB8C6C8|nr:CBS domain-containing protein [Thermogemmatispora sp.]MBX5451614.1 magnesium transporter [Thermogemmatispora sp.]
MRVGKLSDVLVAPAEARAGSGGPTYASALLVEDQDGRRWRVTPLAVQVRDHTLVLRMALRELPPPTAVEREISLAHEVLDKQAVDLERRRPVRVNDVCLEPDWRIVGIDTSTWGLLRRLMPAWLLGARGREAPGKLIAWERLEPLRDGEPAPEESAAAAERREREAGREEPPAARRRPPSGPLAELRPADIADIIHQLTPAQGARLLEGLDNETAADILQEVDTERQTYILEKLSAARAAAILRAMEPDEVADLLARLPEERAQELLRLLSPEESEDVRELLEYAENSAGGLMTTDYLALSGSRSSAEALDALRRHILERDGHAVYIYVVDEEERDEPRLLGVVSVWNLLVASPEQTLQELMHRDLVTVRPEADARSVAEVIAKYNLFAVPVVNDEGLLQGIVTVDDAIDVLLPPERRRRPPRRY